MEAAKTLHPPHGYPGVEIAARLKARTFDQRPGLDRQDIIIVGFVHPAPALA
jgi:hypothetical protein